MGYSVATTLFMLDFKFPL